VVSYPRTWYSRNAARFGAVLLIAALAAQAQTPASVPELLVKTLSGESKRFGTAEFAKLPAATVTATDHDGVAHKYSGVKLRDLLDQAGAPKGDALRGKEMSDYVLAEAPDGYGVVFSLTELDPQFGNTEVLIATKIDGQPLPQHEGPLRLVVPGDKRPARWIRMLTSLTLARAQ
jgi:DMSO/TMAO reductase YedYZ molybdopterin-dependent catalytic subunit